MTQEQKDLFINIMKMGHSMGLTHPIECLTNYTRSLSIFMPYDKITETEEKAYVTFEVFYNTDTEGLNKICNKCYNQGD